MNLEILYRDQFLIAINKPNGLLVHRSKIANDVTDFAIQILRDQIGAKVYPVHRIDRKTSGILLFALDKETNKSMNLLFDRGQIMKKYLAIVRGYTKDIERIDYSLKKENGVVQEAVTNYKTLERVEIDMPFGKFQTQRYSLVMVSPETGRMHQIRKHFNHLRHPIIGDRPHGCNKQNKLFKERWNMNTMLLHASEIEFIHPVTLVKVGVCANLHIEFERALDILDFQFKQ